MSIEYLERVAYWKSHDIPQLKPEDIDVDAISERDLACDTDDEAKMIEYMRELSELRQRWDLYTVKALYFHTDYLDTPARRWAFGARNYENMNRVLTMIYTARRDAILSGSYDPVSWLASNTSSKEEDIIAEDLQAAKRIVEMGWPYEIFGGPDMSMYESEEDRLFHSARRKRFLGRVLALAGALGAAGLVLFLTHRFCLNHGG